MIRGLYTAASGMTTQLKKQDTIANNVANVNTTGFKKSQTIMEQGKEFEIYRKEDSNDSLLPEKNKLVKIGKLGTGVQMAENFVAQNQGSLKETENKLDFAIEGKGFFAFDTPNGIRFGRNGSFSADNEGFIVNGNGHRLLSYDFQGNLGYLKPLKSDFSINADGSLSGVEITSSPNVPQVNLDLQNINNPKNSLLLCEFGNDNKLELEGDSYFYSPNANNLIVSSNSKVHQGFLENSDVNIVKEMVEMINCSRLYESNQKVVTSIDETLTKSNELNKWT